MLQVAVAGHDHQLVPHAVHVKSRTWGTAAVGVAAAQRRPDRALHASRYTKSGGWEIPLIVGAGDGIQQHQLAVGPDGNAFALWRRAETINGLVVLSAFVSRLTPGGDWQGEKRISTGDFFYPKFAAHPDCHALAVWFELDATQPELR